MTLKESISKAIQEFGKGIVTEGRFVNIISDYGGFNDIPYARAVIRDLISDGFMQRIMVTKKDHIPTIVERNELISQILRVLPFQKDSVESVLSCIWECLYTKDEFNRTLELPYEVSHEFFSNEVLLECSSSKEPDVIPNTNLCYKLTDIDKSINIYEIHEPVVEIGDHCFENCTELQSVSMSDSVLKIGKYAFSNCWNLKAISLSSNVHFIDDFCFENDCNLSNVKLPSGLKHIGDGCFKGCTSLKKIYCVTDNPDQIQITEGAFDEKIIKNCTLYVPEGCLSYMLHPVFGKFRRILQSQKLRKELSLKHTYSPLPSSYKSQKDFSQIGQIVLGKTTLSEAESFGYKIEKPANRPFATESWIHTKYGTLWDFSGKGVLSDFSSFRVEKLPQNWYKLGLRKDVTYNELVELFSQWGFLFIDKEEPKVVKLKDRMVLKASLKAYSIDMSIYFHVEFDLGNKNGEGYSCDSKNALYSISAKVYT